MNETRFLINPLNTQELQQSESSSPDLRKTTINDYDENHLKISSMKLSQVASLDSNYNRAVKNAKQDQLSFLQKTFSNGN